MRRTVVLLGLLLSFATPSPAQEDDSTSTIMRAITKTKRGPWEKFEAEFGLRENDQTLVRGNLLRAKYGLDLVTFSVTRFLADAEDALELQYKHGGVRRAAGKTAENRDDDPATRLQAFDDTRLKFDLTLKGVSPYLGVRLIVPY